MRFVKPMLNAARLMPTQRSDDSPADLIMKPNTRSILDFVFDFSRSFFFYSTVFNT